MRRLFPLRFLFQNSLRLRVVLMALAVTLVGGSSVSARPSDSPTASFGFFPSSDRLSELNDYLGSGGIVSETSGLMWPGFIGAMSRELSSEVAFRPFYSGDDIVASALMVDKLAEMTNGIELPAAPSEIGRRVREARAKDSSVPSLLWAGMLREGIGMPRNPKEALAEFLRVAAVEKKSPEEGECAKFALREAVITRLLFARETGDSQALRDAISEAAVTTNVEGAYYWHALLEKFERAMPNVGYAAYGNVDGLFDGARAGDLSCAAVGNNRATLAPAVQAGMSAAQFNLAIREETGADGPANYVEARRLYGLAAAAGMPAAQRRLAEMLVDGRGGPVDLPGAMALFREASAHDGLAAFILGSGLCMGEWGDTDVRQGLELLAIATRRGIWRAGIQRAWYLHLGLARNPDDDAAKICLLGAGDFAGPEKEAAQATIGLVLWNGAVVPAARDEAVRLWVGVPEDRLSPVMKTHLAMAYRLGLGVSTDLAKATTLAGSALKAGLSVAALELAELSLIQKKEGEAIDYFRRAADGGSSLALTRLADCATNGIGGSPQPEVANRLRAQARVLQARGATDL